MASRSHITHPQLRTWRPSHGIVFRPISSTSRASNTAAAAELLDELSSAEYNPELASTDIKQELGHKGSVKSGRPGDRDIPITVPAAVKEETQKPPRPTADQLHELALTDPEQNDLPETSTSYKMPEAIFRAAKNAPPGTVESFWSHSLYRGPPDTDGKIRKPTVHYCRTIHTSERVIKDYFAGKKVIGFDIEWQPEAFKLSKARKNVSLVQIACEDRIALFHLALYPKNAKESDNSLSGLVAPSLKKLMEDPEITKVGVAIKADCTRLRNYLGIHSRSIFELSHLHKLVKFSKSKDFNLINRSLVSLSKQVQEHLHLPLFKGDEVRQTDWSQKLDMAQILYAASDSYAGLQLYHTLELKREALDPVPPRPYYAELNKPIRLAEGIEIPPEEDDPTVRSVDAKVVQRTRKYTKKATKETAEVVKGEDGDGEFTPATELAHSFFTSTPTNRLSSIVRSAQPKGKLGDISHIPMVPSHLSKRSLQTYHLWLQNPALDLDALGSKLRSPPLAARSVAKMIIEAIKADRLPYERKRLREVLRIYGIHSGGTYIPQHPYFELARDSGYNEQMEKEV
jgi:hypothetical protein